LSTWISKQKKLYKKAKVKQWRVDKLLQLGLEFGSYNPTTATPTDSNKHQQIWIGMYKKLQEYKRAHGNCLVPYSHAPDPALGMWLATQRREYHQKSWYGADRQMRRDRKELLEAIGFYFKSENKPTSEPCEVCI
jgi:hypothetical protein